MDQKDSTTHTRKLASATELRGKKSGMPKGKKGGKKMWISLISMVVVLGLAVGAYFLSGIIKPEEEILPAADYLSFSSAGGVEQYLERHGLPGGNTRCLAIGEVCAEALRRRGIEPIVAKSSSVLGLVQALLEAAH